MKRFLNILRYVFWLLVIIPPMLFWAMVIGYVFDEAGDCAENGKVWDYNEKRCRDDCLTWNEVNGCIYMDEEYRRLFRACADKTADCDREKLDLLDKELCKKYNAPLNLKYGYCDFGFEVKRYVGYTTADIFPPTHNAFVVVWNVLENYLVQDGSFNGQIDCIHQYYIEGWSK